MEDLRGAFEEMGYANVRTVIASGNVIFESSSKSAATLEKKIEKSLPGLVGFECDINVFTVDSLKKLVRMDPFKAVKMTAQMRPYATFVKRRYKGEQDFPIKGKGYTMLAFFGDVLCSVVDLSRANTIDFMKILDKQWPGNTTRGWKTIERILK